MRTAAHRGTYKAKPKPPALMPLLLRRALAQLRGDPPESWPNALHAEPPPPGAPYGPEIYGSQYPFPTLSLPHLLPGLSVDVTRNELRHMIERLSRAPLNTAWRTIETRCADRGLWPKDHGLEILLALIESLVPINMLDSAFSKQLLKDIQKSARELVSLLEVLEHAGAPLRGIMPIRPTELPGIAEVARELDFMAANRGAIFAPRGGFAELLSNASPAPSSTLDRALTEPAVLMALLRSLAEREIGTARQRRGSMPQRRAFTIAHRLRALCGPEAAVAIANAATDARITARGLTKNRN